MFQRRLSIAGTLLLTGAAVFGTPDTGLAAGHGGGGHGGGGHFAGGGAHLAGGGGHFTGGGFHDSRYHGNAHYEGYRGSMYHNRGYYGGYGYYPYNGFYGSYYDTNPYDSGYYGGYGAETPSYADTYPTVTTPAVNYQALTPPTAADPDAVANLTVNVPAGTQLWLNGTATTSTGAVRQFRTPPLTPGHRYSYEIQARWNENGHAVTQTQHVDVTAGGHINVSFPISPKSAG